MVKMILESILYQEDINKVVSLDILNSLKNKTILITGSTGLIGSFLIDVLMKLNNDNFNIKIIACASKKESIDKRFLKYLDNPLFEYICQDINLPINYDKKIDYIMHLASNSHPSLFKSDPVGTIKANIIGLNNLLEYAVNNNVKRLLYASTGEVYGQIEGIKEFHEDDIGYVNYLLPRSCYPMSKRAAENLCISYAEQYNMDVVIARPCHTYGPTMTESDSRISATFVRDVLNNKDIVLKSKGEQIRSYCYVADCASAMLYILIKGENKNAYNIANKESITSIYDMATLIASLGNKKVIFDIPKEENSNNNPMQCGVLNSNKLESLGWKGEYSLEEGYKHTLNILKGK